MQRTILNITGFILLLALSFLACDKKKSSGAISPGYGTTGNPNPNVPTVTGNATLTNPASDNTSMSVGGSGWSNPSCGSTNSLNLIGYNGSTNVTLNFAMAPTQGTYNIGPVAGPGVCALSILNAPGQPSGISWIGKSGVVVVNTTSTSINATFSGVVCTQASFNFPTVTASGVLGCSQ